ncbi:MAG: universal stress protein [Saprospiraceae bacterium]|nr:universal stress protein [Saprospiraceae bacterium]
MKKILVPISFSSTSKNSMKKAYSMARKFEATLSLLHCYPFQEYNREYQFEGEDYDKGIRRMLIDFYNECIENDGTHKYNLLTFSGSVSDVIAKISSQYDLLILSRKIGYEGVKNNYFSDKIFYISTKALSPLLILPVSEKEHQFKLAKNAWHIQRHEMEKETIDSQIKQFGIDPSIILTKSLTQKNFASRFWENIVKFTKIHDDDLLKVISKSFDEEQIDLLILVNRKKGLFSIFLKDEAFQIISQFDIPILILQNTSSR